jgi:hypothetical protein
VALTGAIAVGAFSAGGTAALAEDPRPPTVEVTVIHALRGDGGLSVDPRLPDVSALAGQAPFTRYDTYRLLDRRDVPLISDKPAIDELAGGRTLQLTLIGVSGDGGGRRFHVRVSVGEPGRPAFLRSLEVTAGPRAPFFVAGQTYEGGTLVIELVIHE